MLEDLDLTGIQDEQARQCIVRLLNLLEDVTADLRAAQEENQRLRDENSRLKGEQGQPKIKANRPKRPRSVSSDYSSERERHKGKAWSKRSKKKAIRIDREQVLKVASEILPADAEFKGCEDVVVQDIVFGTDNICFHKEKYYSPSEGKSYLAALPRGYEGQFGPGIKSLSIAMYYAAQMTEPKILELLRSVGVQISDGQVSNLLIKGQDEFHAEKDAVYEAGLGSSPWHNLDETGTRVNGQNQHCHIVCNPLYTAYHTTVSKDRQTVIDVLRNGRPRSFLLNDEAAGYLEKVGLSAETRQKLSGLPQEERLDEATMHGLLAQHLPGLSSRQCKWVLDAAAVAAYHVERSYPVARLLVCDDAHQFRWVTEDLGLCWVHEGRHYKKMTPYVAQHRKLLDEFLGRFWRFYDQLLSYREQPTPQERERLNRGFDDLFSTVTGFDALDERIAKTRAKKRSLLMVLEHPEIPLHNNPAELGARMRVRKRAISFGPRTAAGAKAWDSFMTLAATAKKLRVSFYHYMHDRISGANQMPSLASLIESRAKELKLGASWDTS